MSTFNKIYILNLHGHFRKDKNPSATGGKDENVFDIEQGVAIVLLVKNGEQGKSIKYTDLWGSRTYKFEWLDGNVLESIKWKEIIPKPPQYLFVPIEANANEQYLASPSIPDIFPLNKVGIVTARDDLTIKWSRDEIWKTVEDFAKLDEAEAKTKFKLRKERKTWTVKSAQKDLRDSGPTKDNIVPILYRPFDTRYTYYTGKSSGFQYRPMSEVMNHMKQTNISLLFNRREALPGQYADFLVTDNMAEHKASSRYDTCYQAPLYRYTNEKRTPNVSQGILDKLAESYKRKVTPEEVFYYTYAVCYSPSYRTKYDSELRRDYPRIPFTHDSETFDSMANLGRRLIELHLGRTSLHYQTRFDTAGSSTVEMVEHSHGRVTINKSQHFDAIPPEAWDFQIGGYQVLEKWLKSRKGRTLEGADIEQFLRIVEILRTTITIMKEIDRIPFLPQETE